jgi:NO-binding membrane sensor protein with MHYT domain
VGYEPILTCLSLAVPVASSHIAFQFMQFYVTGGQPPRLCTDKTRTPAASSPARSRGPVQEIEDDTNIQDSARDQEREILLMEDGRTSNFDLEVEYGPRNAMHNKFATVGGRLFRSTYDFVFQMRAVPCWRIVLGGVFLAFGIFSMHFIGMLAMRMNATVVWNWYPLAQENRIFFLFDRTRGYIVTSFLIAWMAASASLYIISFCYLLWQQFVAALLMSLAVSGMHFVGTFTSSSSSPILTANRNDISDVLPHRKFGHFREISFDWQFCFYYFNCVHSNQFYILWACFR